MAPGNSHFRAPVKGAPPPAASVVQTREQILLVASNLFATQGYHGTTTREIADAVGIRQPSLFHHFESKAAIMEALLDEDLGTTVSDRERLARSAEPAGVRLYRYVLREVRHMVTSPYNVAGIYSEEVRTTPELAPWYARRRRLHRAIDRIVRDGKQDRRVRGHAHRSSCGADTGHAGTCAHRLQRGPGCIRPKTRRPPCDPAGPVGAR